MEKEVSEPLGSFVASSSDEGDAVAAMLTSGGAAIVIFKPTASFAGHHT